MTVDLLLAVQGFMALVSFVNLHLFAVSPYDENGEKRHYETLERSYFLVVGGEDTAHHTVFYINVSLCDSTS